MKEKLIIKNFGPIKSVELELGRFNVLIGENGTGKSTVAKVLTSIYSLLETTEGAGATKPILFPELSNASYFKKKLSVYEIDKYLTRESVISLHGKDIKFDLQNEIIFSNIEELSKKSNYQWYNNTTYIPADRIATSLFSSATWPGLIDVEEGRIDMPKYFLRFINLFERLKGGRDEFDFTETLGIKFRQDDGIDKVILRDGSEISIHESESAIQSNLSLSVIVAHQAGNRSTSTKTTFLIEEPELNLFPAAQNKLMHYLVDKTMNYGNSMLLTTHSPYILTSLNNMIYAYKVGQHHAKKVEQIIDKKYWLNPNDVAVYMMCRSGIKDENIEYAKDNGDSEDIFDREEGMIMADKIDNVSRKLNREFDSLMDIELGVSEEK